MLVDESVDPIIIIDSEDRELFLLMKVMSDSDFENVEVEDLVLRKMLYQKNRNIRITQYPLENKVFIDFPKKKKFGIF